MIMDDIKNIYQLLSHGNGLKIKEIARELKLDVYHVAEILYSPEYFSFWYENDSSLWFAKEGALSIQESANDNKIDIVSQKNKWDYSRYIGNNTSKALRIYLEEISKYRTFSDEELELLFGKYRSKGDIVAFDYIVKSNLNLVVKIAIYLHDKIGADLEECIQEGNIGLLYAIEKYDYHSGRSFADFAAKGIQYAISSSPAHIPLLIRIPVNQIGNHRNIQRLKKKFEQNNGRPSSELELYSNNTLDIDSNIFHLLFNLPDDLADMVSYVDNLDDFEDYDAIPIDAKLTQESLKYEINKLLNLLPPRERDIIRLYYGFDSLLGESLETIGDLLCLSRERVRQILVKTRKMLKKLLLRKAPSIAEEMENKTIGDNNEELLNEELANEELGEEEIDEEEVDEEEVDEEDLKIDGILVRDQKNDPPGIIDKIDEAIDILNDDNIVVENHAYEQLLDNPIIEDNTLQSHENVVDNTDNKDFRIENKGNHCRLFDKKGNILFSSNGKLKMIEENLYKINYTYSAISIYLVLRKSQGEFTLGNKIINASYHSPLYKSLNEIAYLDQIELITVEGKGRDNFVKIGNTWYDSFGNKNYLQRLKKGS